MHDPETQASAPQEEKPHDPKQPAQRRHNGLIAAASDMGNTLDELLETSRVELMLDQTAKKLELDKLQHDRRKAHLQRLQDHLVDKLDQAYGRILKLIHG